MDATVIPYTAGAVTSADGTTIGYRRLGSGPGLILMSGGYLAAPHYMELATSEGYADLRAEVLLMDGEKTPPPVRNALEAMHRTVPQAKRVTLRGVGREAPVNHRGVPERVAEALRAFFAP
ncbi:hypothetical protein ACTWPT_23455 [Nonomuraea sp. 3N208]|uniref:hypothetical protein n=1 Tax=Nonomuraea sp. 3N208 TaxID=3457421 RepID=UPI003FCE61DC